MTKQDPLGIEYMLLFLLTQMHLQFLPCKITSPNRGISKKGHRLGTAHENTNRTDNHHKNHHQQHDVPPPMVDETLSDADREKIRADRAAAAEARMKKQGLPIQPKKSKVVVDSNAPLRGPNTKPTMTWSVG